MVDEIKTHYNSENNCSQIKTGKQENSINSTKNTSVLHFFKNKISAFALWDIFLRIIK